MGILDYSFSKIEYSWDLGLNLADKFFGAESLEKPHFQTESYRVLGVWYPEMLRKILLDKCYTPVL